MPRAGGGGGRSGGGGGRSSGGGGGGGLHYTKSGNLDMRYSSSKAAVASGYCGGGGSGGGYGGGSSYSSIPAASYYAPTYAAPASSSSELHYRKDGQLDMRYASSRQAGQSAATASSSTACSNAGLVLRKDGQPDMRYSSSKEYMAGRPASAAPASCVASSSARGSADLHYKKDGTLDMRYSSSHAVLASTGSSQGIPASIPRTKSGAPDRRFKAARDYVQQCKFGATGSKRVTADGPGLSFVPAGIPTKKDGTPDMRTTAAKEWVRGEARAHAQGQPLPPYVPTKKDGTPDSSTALGRAFLNELSGGANHQSKRNKYWQQRAQDSDFSEQFQQALGAPVDLPEPTLLDDTPAIQRAMWQDRQVAPQGPGDQDYSRSSETTSLRAGAGASDITVDRWKIEIPESLVPKIAPENLVVGEELGRGAFGVVHKGVLTLPGGKAVDVAVKTLHLRSLTKRDKQMFVDEIRKHARLGKHPNLVNILGYMEEPPAMVLEYVPLGNLDHLLHICEETAVEVMLARGAVKKKVLYGIVDGMRQLHAAGVIHGDLKSQNVLVTADYVAKVTDFGMATLRAKTSSTVASKVTAGGGDDEDGPGAGAGTPGYMAPELLDCSVAIDFSADVYSFGVLMNEVISEQQPYDDQGFHFFGRGPYAAVQYAKQGNRPTIAPHVTPFVKDLIQRCWHKDPKQRPTFEEILTVHLLDPRFVIKDMVGGGSSATGASQGPSATRSSSQQNALSQLWDMLSTDPKGKSSISLQPSEEASCPAPRPPAPKPAQESQALKTAKAPAAVTSSKDTTTAPSSSPSRLVDTLCAMGFERSKAASALDDAGGDVEVALDYLTSGVRVV
eukprot:jgi/Mesvir1/24955/Mv16927-RA.2